MTSILCPCCRAANTAATCRRCKADLTLLVRLRDTARAAAVAALRDRDFSRALAWYDVATRTRGPDARDGADRR